MDDTTKNTLDPNDAPEPTLAQEIKDFEASSAGGKEVEPRSEKHAMAEIPTMPEVEKKLDSYVEKVEKEAELQNPVVDDYTQQILLSSTASQKPKVILPLDDAAIQKGLHHKVWEAVRWLAEWCLRQLKMHKN